MPEPEADSGIRRFIPRRPRTSVLITVLVVAVIGVAYYGYYRRQSEYFAGRNLRLMSMLTAQIEGRMDMYARLVQIRDTPDGLRAVGLSGTPCAPANQSGIVRQEVLESPEGWRVVLQDHGSYCFTTFLASVLRPIFARRVGSAFDLLIVARDDGTVLYSARHGAKTSSLLYREEESEEDESEEPHAATEPGIPPAGEPAQIGDEEKVSEVQITRLQAIRKRKGFREYEPLAVKDFVDASTQTDVDLGGTGYVLFTQPYTFANATLTLDHKPRRWIVCGLVSSSRFRAEVSAISTTVILITVAAIVLAFCAWPFLRIALINPKQALTITDVVLLVMCTIVGAAVITLGLLDAVAYNDMVARADESLNEYSDRLVAGFQDNVVRASLMLDEVAKKTIDEARGIVGTDGVKTCDQAALAPSEVRSDRALTTSLFQGDNALQDYPYVHSIQWIDDSGMQQVRFERSHHPLQCVRDRQYFKDAKARMTWSVPAGVQGNKEYVLEWVHSKSTGEVRALMARKALESEAPFGVVAVATELIDLTHSVGPPGVEMAIIDENGNVIYHSDEQRIGYENFFVETDRNRDLRAAVVARRREHVAAKYWGEDHSMFVQPLKYSAWTLVTFRAKRLTRVLNVEGVLMALVFLLLGAMPYFLLYIAVLLIAPRYRAPRLWPDVSRTRDYLRLAIILAAILLLFWMDICALAPWSSFNGMLILPALAIVTVYLVLHRIGAPAKYNVATAVWIALNAALLAHLVIGDVDPAHRLAAHPLLVKSALILAALAVAALTLLLLWGRLGAAALRDAAARAGASRLYRLCGVLLLAVGVAMPVLGFFSISRRVQSELLVKFAQLRAAADLEHRIGHLEELNATPDNSPRVTRDIVCTPLSFFASSWILQPQPAGAPRCMPDFLATLPAEDTIRPWASALLPVLYEDSLAIRPLFDRASDDELWSWAGSDGYLTLTRKVRLDVDAAQMLWNKTIPPDQTITVQSLVPRLGSVAAWVHLLLGVLIAVPLLVAFWFAATFIARRVLLIDVGEPDWLAPVPLSPSLGDQIFLIRRDAPIEALTATDEGFINIKFADLDRANTWSEFLQTLDSSETGRNVHLSDFEYGINDPAVNLKKLQWLERLLQLPDRTVIVISTVTPSYLMTTPAPEGVSGYFERWHALFERFVRISAEELLLRHEEWKRHRLYPTISMLAPSEPKTWLDRETAHNPFLQQVKKEIAAEEEERRKAGHFEAKANRQHLLDEIGERAETYYAGLWANCSQDEKLLLFQVAQNGLANGKNRRMLRRLIARGLVRRDPNVELFSESFRLHVLEAAQRENLASVAREQRGASTWDSLRVPFFVIIVAFLLLLFTTQKDLLTTTTALATAMTTGLPVIMKLIGVFTERRTGVGPQV